MSVPGEPENDAITAHVIDVFLMASKARQYAIGMGVAAPLPLSVADISAVLDAHPSPLPREELDACIFALDTDLLSEGVEKPESQ